MIMIIKWKQNDFNKVLKLLCENILVAEAMVYWQWCLEFTPRLLHHKNDVKAVVSL